MAFLVSKLKKNAGETVVDYLMITAVVAGIAIPVVQKYAMGPVLNMLNGQKQTLVQFVSQTPKRPVPNLWFAQERVAQFKAAGQIDPGKDIDPGANIAPPGDINPPGEIKSGDVKAPGEIKRPGEIKPPGNLKAPGDVSGGSGDPGGGPGARGGGGSGFNNNGNDGSDFFNSVTGGDKKGEGEDGPGGSKVGYRSSGGGDEYAPRGAKGEAGSRDKATKEEGSKEKNNVSGPDARRRQAQLMGEVAQDERERSSPFDWWFVIKVLIVLLILFLMVLIALSNMKKR